MNSSHAEFSQLSKKTGWQLGLDSLADDHAEALPEGEPLQHKPESWYEGGIQDQPAVKAVFRGNRQYCQSS